ncbi:MAG: DUF6382 domain-containing protein [Coprococcus sp.]
MQEFTYENQEQNTYLVYHFGNESIDTMTLGMITNNKIKGFAKAFYTEINNERYIKYNIASQVTLSRLFMGEVRKTRLLKVFINIVDALMVVDTYMLDKRNIILNADYIYVDASTSEVSMICLPVINMNIDTDERNFFKNIIFSVSFSAQENGDYVARMLAYLNGTDNLSLIEFKELLEGLLADNNPVMSTQPVDLSNLQHPQTLQNIVQPQMQLPQAIMQSQSMNTPEVEIGFSGPSIQNVYVASPKDVKLAKREELIRQEEEKRTREMEMQTFNQPASDMGFAVPGMEMKQYSSNTINNKKSDKKSGKGNKKGKVSSNSEDISFFYLMQHYSKENAAKYKAAKERKKSGNVTVPSQTMTQPQRTIIKEPSQMSMQEMIPMSPQVVPPISQQVPQTMTIPPQPQIVMPVMPQSQTLSVSQTMPQLPQFTSDSVSYNKPYVPDTDEEIGTTVLSEKKKTEKRLYLYRLKNGDKIYIDKKTCRIGKSSDVVDKCISDNSAISRCHAIIYKIDDKCYIEDLNSTNGTFVDDEQITSNSKIALRIGSRISLADEEFELRYE